MIFRYTIPSGYNASNLKETGVKVYYTKKELYELGIIKSKTVYGRCIMVYDKERTICDIIRSRNRIDVAIVNEGIKRYISSKDKNIPILMRYAKKFNVQNVLQRYLEVGLSTLFCAIFIRSF